MHYALEGDGLNVLLAKRETDFIVAWGENMGQSVNSLHNVAVKGKVGAMNFNL